MCACVLQITVITILSFVFFLIYLFRLHLLNSQEILMSVSVTNLRKPVVLTTAI